MIIATGEIVHLYKIDRTSKAWIASINPVTEEDYHGMICTYLGGKLCKKELKLLVKSKIKWKKPIYD